jgi:hypothetical protein
MLHYLPSRFTFNIQNIKSKIPSSHASKFFQHWKLMNLRLHGPAANKAKAKIMCWLEEHRYDNESE